MKIVVLQVNRCEPVTRLDHTHRFNRGYHVKLEGLLVAVEVVEVQDREESANLLGDK